MSDELLANTEVRRLLAEADNTFALVGSSGAGSDAALALDDIYRDIGRAVHRLVMGRGDFDISEDITAHGSKRPIRSAFDDLDEDEPTVIDRPDEDEDAGIVSRVPHQGRVPPR